MQEELDYTDDNVLGSLGADQPESASEDDSVETSNEATDGTESEEAFSKLDSYNPEGSDQAKEGGDPLLEKLNELGIIRDGLPVEFDEVDKVKEYLSKGFDYTAKTQELAEIRRQQEESFTAKEQEIGQLREQFEQERQSYETEILANQAMREVLESFQESDPDVYSMVLNAFRDRFNSYQASTNSPAFSKVSKEVQELRNTINELKGTKEQEKVTGITKEWEEGITGLQTEWGGKLKSLGIKVSPKDWEQVKSVWGSDASNSLSVKNAFWAVMGDKVEAAMASKAKLAETKSRSQKRQAPVHATTNQSFGMQDIDQQINEIIASHNF